jgi:hypothetical protein
MPATSYLPFMHPPGMYLSAGRSAGRVPEIVLREDKLANPDARLRPHYSV